MNRVPHGARTGLALAMAVVCSIADPSQAAPAGPGVCAPPRTVVALVPFADQTGGAWELMTGASPTALVAARLADSLQQSHGRQVVIAPAPALREPGRPARMADDAELLAAAQRAKAEVVLSGVVTSFAHEDRREPGRFGRWGMGAPDARSRAEVAVTIRVLDAHDGSVILESRAARKRAGRSTSSAGTPPVRAGVVDLSQDESIAEALEQVMGDLVRTLAARLDARWQARVIAEGRGIYVIDAGSARGLFTGERLDVWRSGIELLDEDLMRIGDDVRTGAVVVESIDGKGHARVRLAEGEVRRGDLVRPCSGAGAGALSLRR